ncbi:MAG TPA: 4Fe-4S dicluster domain-containing protein [Candidatus Omnitrophica bacterium]|nr:MAG: (Fe-S)-binding protein [Candidatus Omnitrophota bacterium]RKY35734.1 MAG: (Fe-S)-binding protein [Candidatus Omnitrophota bacterium]RKY44575.1 MAG: (Fe-S)-binding protein [Candidatus Omnitrophota bacterium]HEC69986.1 4Fe-4S dicluster domain-containing protein [Candidatus Omnitrophota bacterium]
MKKRIVLHFPRRLVDKPIVYKLVKEFNLEFNILKAEVNPKEEGVLVLEIEGKDSDYKKGLDYLSSVGVKIQPLSEDVIMDRDKCVDCGVCVPLCPTSALKRNEHTLQIEFIQDKCIACGICIKACPYQAMNISL